MLKELGQSIKEVFNKLNQPQQINEIFVDQILKQISLALLQADINIKLIQQLRENIKLKFKFYETEFINLQKLIQKSIIEQLTQLFQNDIESFQPKKGKLNVIMFIGLKGSGKTSTCSKYAYYYQKRGWKVGIICVDTFYNIGFNQIKQNKIPLDGAYPESNPIQIAYDRVQILKREGIEIILIDTSGNHSQQNDLFEEMKQIESMIQPDNVILVMDSTFGQSCYDQTLAFKNSSFNLGSIIITKLDGHAKGGGTISTIVSQNIPIDFICNGECFEDLQEFQSSQFIRKLLGLEKRLLKNLNNFILIGPPEKQFTLRDLELEIKNILKVGLINYFLSFQFKYKINEQEQIQKFKRYLYIMNSMTSKELDGQVTLSNSRIKRIAKGSGTTIEQVNDLLQIHKFFIKVQHPPPKNNFKELINKGFSQKLIEDIQKDPQILGGYKNIQDMMRNIGNIQNNNIYPI